VGLAQGVVTEDRSILSLDLGEHALPLNGESAAFELDTELANACRHVLETDGKQLRPSILLEAARNGPRPTDPAVERAAAAVELLHIASLTHDDVIDGGELRRGQETVRVRYGDSASVLSGGWLYARAVELLALSGNEPTQRFCEATARICEGQMQETEDLFNTDRSPQRYLDAIEGKTATLFALAAWLGARLAGAEEEVVEALDLYGRELGLGFQIADDVLDLIADDAITGKAQGSDVCRGVYTLPLLFALESEPDLGDLLQDPAAGTERLPELIEAIRRSGGFEKSLADCAFHLQAAKAATVDLPHSDRLCAIADAVLGRCTQEALA
jgi:heptaprenyl diphosphate synthase